MSEPPTFPPVRTVAVCPQCCGELRHEGVDSYWCSACRKEWFFTQVELHEDDERDDD